jgi:FkbM family methyltransferase
MDHNAPLLDRLVSVSTAASRKAVRALYAAVPGKQLMFEPLRGKLPNSVFQHLHFCGEISISVGARAIRMRHYGYQIENALYWQGIDTAWEPTTMAVWRTLAAHARSVLDIGANTGLFALVAQALNPSATVVAVEPVARIYEKLAHNVALNGMGIVCVCEGVSDTVGLGTFVDPGTAHFYTITIEQGAGESAGLEPGANRRTVALTTIDALSERLGLGHVDLVKLDVESHEPAALSGATKTLRHHRPNLIVEIWNDSVGAAVDAILRDAGYLGYRISESAKTLTLCDVTRTEGTANFLFVPAENRDVVESRLRTEAPSRVAISS